MAKKDHIIGQFDLPEFDGTGDNVVNDAIIRPPTGRFSRPQTTTTRRIENPQEPRNSQELTFESVIELPENNPKKIVSLRLKLNSYYELIQDYRRHLAPHSANLARYKNLDSSQKTNQYLNDYLLAQYKLDILEFIFNTHRTTVLQVYNHLTSIQEAVDFPIFSSAMSVIFEYVCLDKWAIQGGDLPYVGDAELATVIAAIIKQPFESSH